MLNIYKNNYLPKYKACILDYRVIIDTGFFYTPSELTHPKV